MTTRNEMIAALRAKLANPATPVTATLTVGATYNLELASQERVVKATLHHVTPEGFSFQLARAEKRLFVRNADLRPGPAGVLLAMA